VIGMTLSNRDGRSGSVPGSQPRARAVRWLVAAAIASVAFAPASPLLAQGFVSDRRPGTANVTPKDAEGLDLRNRLGQHVPGDLTFRDSTGSTVRLGDLFNRLQNPSDASGMPESRPKRPIVLQMMYFRCPLLCPMVLDRFTKSMQELEFTVGKEFEAVVISFDPRDTLADAQGLKSATLMQYAAGTDRAAKVGGDDKLAQSYHFWLSEPETANALAANLGFSFRYLPESGEYAHGAVVFVLTPEGKVSRYVTGLDYPAKDVRLALVEASSGTIGSWPDRLMLRCFHFDPSAGGYTLQAMRLMQIVSIASVVSLGSLITVLKLRERGRRVRWAGADSGSLMNVQHAAALAAEGQVR
jgi:protein SCO1